MRPDILHEISEKERKSLITVIMIETHEDLFSLSLKSMQSREWKRLFGTLLKIP